MTRARAHCGLLALLGGVACGLDRVSSEGGGGDGTSTITTSTTGEADSSGTVGSTATAWVDADASSSGGSDSSESGRFPTFPKECEEPEATIDVTTAIGPDGPMTIDEAWFGADACSSAPYVVLVQQPTIDTVGIELSMLVETWEGAPAPYLGVYPVAVEGNVDGTIEVLESLSGIDPGMPDPDARLHGLIEVHDGGWDISVEVDLIYCGASDCFCPCR